ncbi:peptide chain release factor N(5)-glutamine methyltransferase [Christiangramia salexigens]|uniref:Release factor glutamine methyltransferase n=1 Tax=Christiangramia salexigens TaxID=1913577 RepID=A0A1L3J1H2_9FLAO|nr:peptide chain release factor N(5)-glutamine methyltransferase [Christiangramia salexigens]APG58976.1 protein-(glutamine-N5) methyltransferase, release factor-specific [Christiangramia salexigens]
MRLSQLKNQFNEHLKEEYPETEIDSFFYLLTEDFLGMKRIDLALNPDYEIEAEQERKFMSALQQLKEHVPVQYIIGQTEFFGLKFKVDKNVLIPRPETEELIDWIISDLKEDNETIKILDIGTGSGCIAISLASQIEGAEIFALDVSNEALRIAKENADMNGVQINFEKKDILATEDLDGKFNIIVSNPPYVRNLEKEAMHRNVLEYEPDAALYVADSDPLIFYNKISRLAKAALNPGGCLYFEINQYLPEETRTIVEDQGFEVVLKKDLFENFRMIKAVLKK